MLGIFNKELVNAPKELNSPASLQVPAKPNHHQQQQLPQDSLKDFLSSHPTSAFSLSFANKATLAFAPPARPFPNHRLFCGVDDIYCTFLGNLNNLSTLNKQYGLSKFGSEAMFVIEAYRTLRDRGPFPAHQVLKDLDGSFGFVLYDTKAETVFVALGGDGGVKLFWGIASDGSVMISDNLELIKASCAKSFAPFPTGADSRTIKLNWEKRSNICKGTARGLAYLHEELVPPIVHRDIKASNILLDKDFTPKIGDFGLAKLFPDNITHITTKIRGTSGYLAPEYVLGGKLTKKADVYSFGVLVLEIVSGRSSGMQKLLLEWAWQLYEEGQLIEMADPELEGFPEDEVIRYIKVALFCTQATACRRPTMSQVVDMLSRNTHLNEKEIFAPG